MITHKHLKQLGFSRTGNVWCNYSGIVWNGIDGYWRLRKKCGNSVQMEMFERKCYKEQQNIVYETIGGEKIVILNINIGIVPRFFSPTEHLIWKYSFWFVKIDDKQLSLW